MTPSPLPRLARVACAGVLGLVPLLYLVVRAAAHPLVNWGAPSTPGRFWWTVTARAFQKAVARGTTSDVPGVVVAVASETYVVGALLALAGSYLLLRKQWRLGVLMTLPALGGAAAPALVGFDPHNPDAYGYLATTIALLAVLAVVLPAVALARSKQPRWAAATLVVCAAATLPFAWPRITLAHHHEAARTFSHFLDGAPPRSSVVTSYYQTIFGLWYLRAAEGARPDADLIHRHFLAYPGYRDELARARPERAAMLAARDVDVSALLADPARLVEYDLDLPVALGASAVTLDVGGHPDEPQARRFAAWQRFLAAHRACRLPDVAARQRALDDARALIGADPELAALARRCGKN